MLTQEPGYALAVDMPPYMKVLAHFPFFFFFFFFFFFCPLLLCSFSPALLLTVGSKYAPESVGKSWLGLV